MTLTTISLLAAHLTDENHGALLDAARHASRRDVERLVASLHAQPDIPATVRRIPGNVGPHGRGVLPSDHADETPLALLAGSVAESTAAAEPAPMRMAPRPVVAPLAADRYLLRVTIGATTHAKLERARDLLRHTVPNGDPATVLDRALTVLVDQLERRKSGRVSRPSGGRSIAKSPGRHVPSAVKREVWARDQGRCAFVCPRGRCSETGFLEYHHVRPFAAGGATDAANLELRCRAHNAHEATVFLTNERRAAGRSASPYATPLRQS